MDRDLEEIVYVNARANIIMYPRQIITDKQRKVRSEMSRFNRKQKSMSELVKRWSTGDNTPENGSFVGFTLSRGGRVCLPKFY